MDNQAIINHPILDVLQTRWSPRAFSNRSVSRDSLASLFEAARWAPSANNIQPWSFIVTERSSQSDCYRELVKILSGWNQVWAANAPVLVVAVANPNPRTGKVTPTSYYDLGQAVADLTVQAEAMGLRVHQMGGFDAEKASQLFEISADSIPVTVLAIGYEGDPETLPDELREREKAPRVRKQIKEFVFKDHWKHPYPFPAER